MNNLRRNTIASLSHQCIALICGFILPRKILAFYGSEVNGLVNSITQFLQVIAFLELGVGAVVQSALYIPLVQKDTIQISRIVSSAQTFFKRLAFILLIYVIALMAVYPYTVRENFGWLYTASMILTLSINTFAQYYFGIVNSLLLNSDQRGYIQYIAQIVTVVLNTVICVILIQIGFGIHTVKLTTSMIYLMRPLFLRYYVRKHYSIDRKVKVQGEPIPQKWNGIAQHLASIVLNGTGNILLTIFSTLANVSIYSVYSMVILGIKNMLLALMGGIQSRMGALWAKNDDKKLYTFFGQCEWAIHTATVFIFGCTGKLMVPFVMVYTRGVTDVEYAQPLFSAIFTLANAAHCLRLPYNTLIQAAGHYKQTQNSFINAMCLGLVISVAGVVTLGLVGVALGPLIAMSYQTVWMVNYISRNIINWPKKNFCKQMFVDLLTIVLAMAASMRIELSVFTYWTWILEAIQVALIWVAVIFVVNLIVYRPNMETFLGSFFEREA